jgi:hypothetical protein
LPFKNQEVKNALNKSTFNQSFSLESSMPEFFLLPQNIHFKKIPKNEISLPFKPSKSEDYVFIL